MRRREDSILLGKKRELKGILGLSERKQEKNFSITISRLQRLLQQLDLLLHQQKATLQTFLTYHLQTN